VEFILDHLLISNQLSKAKWTAEKALEHFPTNSAIIIRLAQATSISGDINKALKMLLNLERMEANNIDIQLSIATCYSQLKYNYLAIKYFQCAFSLASGDEKLEIAIDLAMEYENNEDYASAISMLQDAIKTCGLNDLLVYELAFCYERIEEYDNAIKCFLDYTDEEPYSFTTWYNLGNTYSKIGDLTNAIWAYEYSILIQQDFIPALYNIANAYLDNDEITLALEHYNRCLEHDENDPMVFCSLGECYEEIDEFERAYEMYSESAALLPELADAWMGKGIMSDYLGFGQRAIRETLVAVELHPKKQDYWRELAHIYENNNKQEKAINAFKKAIEIRIDNNDLIIEYLSLLAGIAIEDVFLAIENNTNLANHPAAQLVLCYCNWMMGNQSEAMILLDQVIFNDASLAKSLFLHFPTMKSESYYVNRLQEIDEIENNEEF
jgi:tetratricopeptide (TPR) repeat protein